MSIPCPIPRWVARGQPADDGSDFAAVDQALQGWWTAAELYPEDRFATVAEMWRLGWSQGDTADRLATTKFRVEADRQHLRYLARKEAGWFG